MNIYERVSDETKEKLKAHRPKEKLSKKDLDELMGVDRDTYKRVNGRVKRK